MSTTPTYERLFGSDAYHTVDPWRSVLSPAAYFVDLMKLIDQYITTGNGARLKKRRPDLWTLPLDEHNTTNLSRFMQSFLTSFCVSSNRKRRTSGHIFQGRFKAQLVEDELYRSRLSRYIHLNLVRTRTLKKATPEERSDHLYKFQWSSYLYYLGIAKCPSWLDMQPVLSLWGKTKREQIQRYSESVGEGLCRGLGVKPTF